MTDAQHVLIRGQLFLYRQKAPFVKSGKSVFGALEFNATEQKVRCHECGDWFGHVGLHIGRGRAHNLSVSEYKTKHGLLQSSALCSETIREARIRTAREIGLNEFHIRFGFDAERGATSNQVARLSRGAIGPRLNHERANEDGRCHAQILSELRRLTERLGRLPTGADLRERGLSPESVCLALNVRGLREAVDLGLLAKPPNVRAYSREQLIEILRDFFVAHGRLPVDSDRKRNLIPNGRAFTRVFGGMKEAYAAAGLSLHYKEGTRGRKPIHVLSVNGISRSVREWARALGLSIGTVESRVNRGWPLETVLVPPKISRGGKAQ